MAAFDEHQYAVVRELLPVVLGLDESEPGESERIDIACDRLSDFFESLARPDVSPGSQRLPTLLTLLHAVIKIEIELEHPGEEVRELSDYQRRKIVAQLFEPDSTLVGRLLERAEALFGKHVPTQLDIARSLREMFSLAYYAGQRSDVITGYTPIWKRPEIVAVATDLQQPPDRLDVAAIKEKHLEGFYDTPAAKIFANDGRPKVAIIGSGAGGAVMAAKLAAAKKYDVVVLEAGPRFTPRQYPLDPMSSMSLLAEDGLQTLTKNLDIQLLRGRVVGGSTVLTSGMTVRARPKTLAHWHTLGIDQPSMNAALDAVEKRLRIELIAEDLTIDSGRRFRDGVKALNEDVMFDVPPAYIATNASQQAGNPRPSPDKRGDRCLACGLCNYGCHFGHKLSMDLSYLLDAEADGAKIHPNVPVAKLVATLGDDGVARVKGFTLARDPEGEVVEADYVVLAGGAVGSSALLLRSVEQEALAWLPCRDNMGQKLGFNYGATVIARWKDTPPKPGDTGIQISFVASKSNDESYVLETAFVPPGFMSTLVPGVGKPHRAWMRHYRDLAMCVNTIGSPQTGTIDSEGRVTYELSPDEMDVVRSTMSLITRGYLRAGAAEVGFSGIRGADDDKGVFYPGEERDPEKLMQKIREAVPDAERIMLASAHPQGGLRFSKTPEDGVVGEDFRVHGVGNLFVADASLFPSTIVVNPQWTVMALSLVASQKVIETIERERV
jgi:choline dehydrogenase-like flavoprotein